MDEAFNILTLISGEFIGTDLSRYIDRNKIIEKDVKKLRNLILNKDYLPPVPKELKGLKRIKARYNRRSQRRWLYRYLPSSAWERSFNIFKQSI
jgi:hypothetical protein